MYSINPYDLPIRERHQLIIGAVGPRPICWASTVNEAGEINLAPYSFFNAYSSNPPILVFSSNRRGRDNTTKDTLHNIEATREVVINIVPYSLVNQMTISSTDYSAEVNEFEKAGVTPLESELVKPFRVKESPVQFECKVTEIIPLGSEGGAGNLFICEIVKMHFSERVLDEDKTLNPFKLDLVARMGKSYYCRANKDSIFEIENPFPKQNLGFDKLPLKILESKVLTGNEIAQLAMETEIPSEEDVADFMKVNEHFVHLSNEEKHSLASKFIAEAKVADAFKLLLF
ncbi:MAG: flavin reductase family protein [Chitinophagales bacterium]